MLSKGCATSRAGKLVTFGIVPSEPHTGYGYIEAGDFLEVLIPLPLYGKTRPATAAST